MIPRLRNYLWEQLAADELTASIIADGFHLPHPVIKVFARAKEQQRLVLVSDVGPMGGLTPGKHRWGDVEVEVYEDGHLGLAGTEFLAGAGHLLDRAVAQFARATRLPMEQILPLCTVNPSRLLGIGGRTAEGEVSLPSEGDPADLVQFSLPRDADSIVVDAAASGKLVFFGHQTTEGYHDG
jgi:N-acetylglucosamine-6-phosphate deacetylase